MIINELNCRSIYPKLLYLWYGSSSLRSFAFTPGSIARLYENMKSFLNRLIYSGYHQGHQCMDMILVMFKLDNSSKNLLNFVKKMEKFTIEK